MKLLKINYIIQHGRYAGKKAQQFFNCDLETAINNCHWLESDNIISTEIIDTEIEKNEYFGSDGMLRAKDLSEKPEDTEDWNAFYKKTTGNALPDE